MMCFISIALYLKNKPGVLLFYIFIIQQINPSISMGLFSFDFMFALVLEKNNQISSDFSYFLFFCKVIVLLILIIPVEIPVSSCLLS
jgi:hypothetical protein